MSNDLLPPSASRMERVAARVCASLGEVPVPLRQLWNPWTCRADLLPYLAWAFSVDRWDEAWPISTKRKAVADAFYLHKHKGTTSAVRRVVALLLPSLDAADLCDGVDEEPRAQRGIFAQQRGQSVEIGVADDLVGDQRAGDVWPFL